MMNPTPDYDEVLNRIQTVYSSCSKQEQQYLRQILNEMSISGESATLEQIWLADFKEMPVSIDQFICDPYYLGGTNRNGEGVYPFWRNMFREVFEHGNRYTEICLSGSTRIGKSSSAVTIMAYMLYRLMLYRDPHSYFHKKAVSRFTIAFANLTKELAAGIAFHEFNTTLQSSPWFNDHGSFNKSVSNPIYIPEGNKIDIVPASDAAHLLGMQIWCLVGDTKIITDSGRHDIKELDNERVNILQYDYINNIECYTECYVMLTNVVNETIRIELENGSFLEGTPEHLVMLSDGTYKALGDLTLDDELMEVQSC